MTWDSTQAIPSVATGIATSVHAVTHSRERRCARVNSGAMPTAAGMMSSIVIRSPPMTSRESRIGAPNRGTLSQGAAVLAAW